MIDKGDAHRLGDLLRAAVMRLGGDAAARVDAEVLLAYALERDRGWLIAHRDDELPDASCHTFSRLIEERESGHPVAYLTARRGFWNLELEVGPGVLIPRPETELLVQLALDRIPLDRALRIVDLGTGSGSVALALASERPQIVVVGVDASRDALLVAEANAHRLILRNVLFLRGHWLDALRETKGFALVVANPPYLPEDDPHLQQGDLRFEPRMALASGGDGLDAIREIVRSAQSRLRRRGELLIEHGATQGADVRALLAASGYASVQTWQDLGGLDRVSGGLSAH